MDGLAAPVVSEVDGVRAALQQAENLRRLGKLDELLGSSRRALDAGLHELRHWRRQARQLREENEWPGSIVVMRKAGRLKAALAELVSLSASVFEERQMFPEMEEGFRLVAALDPTQRHRYFAAHHRRLEAALGNPATQAAAQSEQVQLSRHHALRNAASILRDTHQFASAIALLRQIGEGDPCHMESTREIAAMFKKEGDLEAALNAMASTLSREFRECNDLLECGHLHKLQGNWEQAKHHYAEALLESPFNRECYIELGAALSALGLASGAIFCWRMSMDKHSEKYLSEQIFYARFQESSDGGIGISIDRLPSDVPGFLKSHVDEILKSPDGTVDLARALWQEWRSAPAAPTAASADVFMIECRQPSLSEDRPRVLSGKVFVKGWSASTHGFASIGLYINGRFISAARQSSREREFETLHPFLQPDQKTGFHFVLDTHALPNGLARLEIRVADRIGRIASTGAPFFVHNTATAYETWLAERHQACFTSSVHTGSQDGAVPVHLLLDVEGSPTRQRIVDTLTSLADQFGVAWRLLVPCPNKEIADVVRSLCPEGTADRLVPVISKALSRAELLAEMLKEVPDGALVGVVMPGDRFDPFALHRLAQSLEANPGAVLCYGDHDRRAVDGRRLDPFLKPAWSPILLQSRNYPGRVWLAPVEAIRRCGGFDTGTKGAAAYDLLLRLTGGGAQVLHVDEVLASLADYREALPEEEKVAARFRRQEGALPAPGAAGAVSVLIYTETSGDSFAARAASLATLLQGMDADVMVAVHRPVGAVGIPLPARWSLLEPHACTGLGAAVAAAAGLAAGERLLVLTDPVLSADLPHLARTLSAHAARPGVGMVGPRIVDSAGRILAAGLAVWPEQERLRPLFAGAPAAPADRAGDAWRLADAVREVTALPAVCCMLKISALRGLPVEDPAGNPVDDPAGGGLPPNWAIAGLAFRLAEHGHATLVAGDCDVTLPAPPDGDRLFADLQTPPAAFSTRWGTALCSGDRWHSPLLVPAADGEQPNDAAPVVRHTGAPAVDARKIREILVLRLDHLGDTVISMPSVLRLKALFPEARITMMVGSWARGLVEGFDAVDRVITYDYYAAKTEQGFRALDLHEARRVTTWLREYRFDMAVDLQGTDPSRKFLQLSGAPVTAGFNPDLFSWLTVGVRISSALETRRGQRFHHQFIVESLIDAIERAIRPVEPARLRLPPAVTQQAAGHFVGLEGPRMVFHLGAGTRNKMWSIRRYALLAHRLRQELGAQVVVIGSANEKPLAEEFFAALPKADGIRDFVGALKLEESLALMGECDVFVGNDSGPKHMAAMMGLATVTPHPGSGTAQEWGAAGARSVALQSLIPCAPCGIDAPEECGHGLACLQAISVDALFDQVRALLPATLPSREASGATVIEEMTV